ncbi:hypothetical protein LINGRAHAP2_LOCUS27988, partial [Linum grandiflorum]
FLFKPHLTSPTTLIDSPLIPSASKRHAIWTWFDRRKPNGAFFFRAKAEGNPRPLIHPRSFVTRLGRVSNDP